MIKKDYVYHAEVVRVIDGDTISVDLDMGFNEWKRDFPVRLAHFNAPEKHQTGGPEAMEHLKVLLGDGKVVLKTFKPKDKYGRYLAEVHIGDLNVNDAMVEDGHGVPYEGGERP